MISSNGISLRYGSRKLFSNVNIVFSPRMKNKYISGEMRACLKRYWGYEQFRPWQEDTILAIMDERETLTILPTGGASIS